MPQCDSCRPGFQQAGLGCFRSSLSSDAWAIAQRKNIIIGVVAAVAVLVATLFSVKIYSNRQTLALMKHYYEEAKKAFEEQQKAMQAAFTAVQSDQHGSANPAAVPGTNGQSGLAAGFNTARRPGPGHAPAPGGRPADNDINTDDIELSVLGEPSGPQQEQPSPPPLSRAAGQAQRGLFNHLFGGQLERARDVLAAVAGALAAQAEPPSSSVEDSAGVMREARHIPRGQLTLGQELGQGYFGVVRSAVWKDGIRGKQKAVAVKLLHNKPKSEAIVGLFKEILMMAKMSHRNIVRLEGMAINSLPLMVVMELCPNGSVFTYLRKCCANQPTFPISQLMLFASGIASGLAYLHQQYCLHCDLAARNVLLGENLEVKLADFGLAVEVREEYMREKDKTTATRWASPEILSGHRFSAASDVWAFGVTLFEIFTMCSRMPYGHIRRLEEVKDQVLLGLRLQPPGTTPPTVAACIEACLETQPGQRPTTAELEQIFAVLCCPPFASSETLSLLGMAPGVGGDSSRGNSRPPSASYENDSRPTTNTTNSRSGRGPAGGGSNDTVSSGQVYHGLRRATLNIHVPGPDDEFALQAQLSFEPDANDSMHHPLSRAERQAEASSDAYEGRLAPSRLRIVGSNGSSEDVIHVVDVRRFEDDQEDSEEEDDDDMAFDRNHERRRLLPR